VSPSRRPQTGEIWLLTSYEQKLYRNFTDTIIIITIIVLSLYGLFTMLSVFHSTASKGGMLSECLGRDVAGNGSGIIINTAQYWAE
jgi:hypothetical protein